MFSKWFRKNDANTAYSSAYFVGSKEEFNRFIGPRLRNVVNLISKKYKNNIGRCEHCGNKGTLEAAHKFGRERTTIIDELLINYQKGDNYEVELAQFEEEFKDKHFPTGEVILVLCPACHSAYDTKHKLRSKEKVAVSDSKPKRSDRTKSFKPEQTSVISEKGHPSRKDRIYNNTEIQKLIVAKAKTLPQEELEKMCRQDYSKSEFNNNYSIFVRIPATGSFAERDEAIQDHTGRKRWTWKYEFHKNGYAYAITTQWYDRNDEYVKKWLSKN